MSDNWLTGFQRALSKYFYSRCSVAERSYYSSGTGHDAERSKELEAHLATCRVDYERSSKVKDFTEYTDHYFTDTESPAMEKTFLGGKLTCMCSQFVDVEVCLDETVGELIHGVVMMDPDELEENN